MGLTAEHVQDILDLLGDTTETKTFIDKSIARVLVKYKSLSSRAPLVTPTVKALGNVQQAAKDFLETLDALANYHDPNALFDAYAAEEHCATNVRKAVKRVLAASEKVLADWRREGLGRPPDTGERYLIRKLARDFEETYRWPRRWKERSAEDNSRAEAEGAQCLGMLSRPDGEGWRASPEPASHFHQLLKIVFEAAGEPKVNLSSTIRRTLPRRVPMKPKNSQNSRGSS